MTTRAKKKNNSSKARKGKAAFEPRARLLRMIGAELISDDVVAMTELVKNSHDADASQVNIVFQDVAEGDGVIVIEDDGDGMDLDALLGRWMQPAGSLKGRSGIRQTRLGRRFLGEKGMGRFAVDKLAAKLQLISRKRGSKDEIVAHFNWDQAEEVTFECEPGTLQLGRLRRRRSHALRHQVRMGGSEGGDDQGPWNDPRSDRATRTLDRENLQATLQPTDAPTLSTGFTRGLPDLGGVRRLP